MKALIIILTSTRALLNPNQILSLHSIDLLIHNIGKKHYHYSKSQLKSLLSNYQILIHQKKKIARDLQGYLSLRNLSFQQNLRTDLGVLAVLVAINQVSSSFSFEQFESRIVDFVTLSDFNYSKSLNRGMIIYLLKAIHKRSKSNIQKNVRQHCRLKYAEIFLEFIQELRQDDLFEICDQIKESTEKDHYNFITRMRFARIFNKIQQKIKLIIKQYLSPETSLTRKEELQRILTSRNIEIFINLLTYYEFRDSETASLMADLIISRSQNKTRGYNFSKNLLYAFNKSPYTELNENETFRDRILAFIQTKMNDSSAFRSFYSSFSLLGKRYLVQKIFEDQYHRTFKSLNFENVQDQFKILRKSEIKHPKIPDFTWRLLKLDESQILPKPILNDLIYNIYPEKISASNIKNSIQELKRQKTMLTSDNQANFRVWRSLQSLGYKFKKQPFICQRQVDLLIEDNIILQVDGQGHFSYINKDLRAITTFRNLHLIMRGYKIVVMTIYEYNFYRSQDMLTKIIQKKLELIKQQDIVYVE